MARRCENFLSKGHGFNLSCDQFLVWDGVQWRDSADSARVNPALLGYLKKSDKGKQDGYVKVQDGWTPAPPPLHFLAEGP